MIPTPFALRVRSSATSGADEFGNATASTTERDWHVHAIAPGAMSDPFQPNRDVSLVAYTILAPASDDVPTEADEVQVDGEWLPVNGRPADWTRGPWAAGNAGVSVELAAANG